LIVDSHVHHMPVEVYRQFHDPSAPPTKTTINGRSFILHPILHRLDDCLRAMDFAGVDLSLLTLSQWNASGPKICRQINEGFAELVTRNKSRLRAAGCVPVGDTEAAVNEIDYMIKELGLSGIALETSEDQHLTASSKEQMWPIYAKAVEYDVPIFWHPNLLPYGTENDYTIAASVGRGFDISRLILRILYSVFPDFPTIKMVIPHFGGGFLAHKQRAVAFFDPPPDLAAKLPKHLRQIPKSPIETEEFGFQGAFDALFNRLYIDGAGSAGWEPITRLAFTTVCHDRLCFGTDFPFETHAGRDLKQYLESIRDLDVSDESKQAFRGGNMAKLLKLS
jgi:predicted TIM-barrel fold metal-dependent hydrolase